MSALRLGVREAAQRCDGATQRGSGIREPGAVEVHEHAHAVRRVAQCRHLVGCVHRAQLGALRDADHAGLRVVLHALQVRQALELLGHQLGGRGRQREQLGAERTLGCAGLVDGDVRPLAAHHALGWVHHRGQRHHVGASAVEHQERLAGGAEQVAEASMRLVGPAVAAVGECVPVVGRHHRLDHRRVGAGRIVAGEGPIGRGWHGGNAGIDHRRPVCRAYSRLP